MNSELKSARDQAEAAITRLKGALEAEREEGARCTRLWNEELAEAKALLAAHNLDPREVMSRGLHESRMSQAEADIQKQIHMREFEQKFAKAKIERLERELVEGIKLRISIGEEIGHIRIERDELKSLLAAHNLDIEGLVSDLEEIAGELRANQGEPAHPGRDHFSNKAALEMYRQLSSHIEESIRHALKAFESQSGEVKP